MYTKDIPHILSILVHFSSSSSSPLFKKNLLSSSFHLLSFPLRSLFVSLPCGFVSSAFLLPPSFPFYQFQTVGRIQICSFRFGFTEGGHWEMLMAQFSVSH